MKGTFGRYRKDLFSAIQIRRDKGQEQNEERRGKNKPAMGGRSSEFLGKTREKVVWNE